MKRYALLKLCNGGNLVIDETVAATQSAAIHHFQSTFKVNNFDPQDPKKETTINDDGYLKVGEVTFTIAGFYCPYQ
jgi:hypothetical protein